MKNILLLLLCLGIGVCVFAQETEPKVEVPLVEIFKDEEGKDMIRIQVKNLGRFLSYPVVQVKHKGKFIANEGGNFETYGISENTTDEFEFPIILPEGMRKINLDILVGEPTREPVVIPVECFVPKKSWQEEIDVKIIRAEIFKDEEGKNMIRIQVKNVGRFMSYPVVQVKHKGKLISNEEGSFDLYGISENATEKFVFPITLPDVAVRHVILDILVGEGRPGEVIKQVKCKLPR